MGAEPNTKVTLSFRDYVQWDLEQEERHEFFDGEVDSLSLMLAAVASGDGVGLMPEHSRKLPHTGVAFVRLTAPVPTTELLLVQAKGTPSAEMATLAELIAERAGKVIE
jgi:DNA-binding transcriptional LysR family regulator